MGQGGLELDGNFEWKTISCLDRALHQVQNSEQTLEIKLQDVEAFAQNVMCQHYIISYGDNTARIKNLCNILGIEII